MKSYNNYFEEKTFSQINFGCSRPEGGPVITEADLQFMKTSLWSVKVKRILEK